VRQGMLFVLKMVSEWTDPALGALREMRLVWARERVRSSIGHAGEYVVNYCSYNHQPSYRVPTGKVVFEIGGGIREEIARDGMHFLSLFSSPMNSSICPSCSSPSGRNKTPSSHRFHQPHGRSKTWESRTACCCSKAQYGHEHQNC
jgi:hypothetical protein